MKSFTDLHVWREGLELLKEIHRLTEKFPPEERYELTKQLRRAAKSILANIAEGFGRYTYADRAAKYIIARGECTEVEAELLMAVALAYVSESEARSALEKTRRVGRMISGLVEVNRVAAKRSV